MDSINDHSLRSLRELLWRCFVSRYSVIFPIRMTVDIVYATLPPPPSPPTFTVANITSVTIAPTIYMNSYGPLIFSRTVHLIVHITIFFFPPYSSPLTRSSLFFPAFQVPLEVTPPPRFPSLRPPFDVPGGDHRIDGDEDSGGQPGDQDLSSRVRGPRREAGPSLTAGRQERLGETPTSFQDTRQLR